MRQYITTGQSPLSFIPGWRKIYMYVCVCGLYIQCVCHVYIYYCCYTLLQGNTTENKKLVLLKKMMKLHVFVRKWHHHLVQRRYSVGTGQSMVQTQRGEPGICRKKEKWQQIVETGKRKRIADLTE